MLINNILVFDDRDWIANIANEIPKYIREGLQDTPRRESWYSLPPFELAEYPKITCCYQKPEKNDWVLYKMEEGLPMMNEWSDPVMLNTILTPAVDGGCLILCDYRWDAHTDHNFLETLVKFLETFDKGNILFILYTTYDSEAAQKWLKEKKGTKTLVFAGALLELHNKEKDLSLEMVKEYFSRHGGAKR